jgi:hypothetical protein
LRLRPSRSTAAAIDASLPTHATVSRRLPRISATARTTPCYHPRPQPADADIAQAAVVQVSRQSCRRCWDDPPRQSDQPACEAERNGPCGRCAPGMPFQVDLEPSIRVPPVSCERDPAITPAAQIPDVLRRKRSSGIGLDFPRLHDFRSETRAIGAVMQLPRLRDRGRFAASPGGLGTAALSCRPGAEATEPLLQRRVLVPNAARLPEVAEAVAAAISGESTDFSSRKTDLGAQDASSPRFTQQRGRPGAVPLPTVRWRRSWVSDPGCAGCRPGQRPESGGADHPRHRAGGWRQDRRLPAPGGSTAKMRMLELEGVRRAAAIGSALLRLERRSTLPAAPPAVAPGTARANRRAPKIPTCG